MHTYIRITYPSLTKQNLNRTQNHEVIALLKTKRTSFRTLQGGTLGRLSREAKFKQDAKPRSIYSVRTEWVD